MFIFENGVWLYNCLACHIDGVIFEIPYDLLYNLLTEVPYETIIENICNFYQNLPYECSNFDF